MKSESKAWGFVEHVFLSPKVAVSLLEVVARTRSSWHYHRHRKNAFLVQRGVIVVECHPQLGVLDEIPPEPIRYLLRAGESMTVDEMHVHRFRVIEHGNVIEVYTPASDDVAVEHDDIVRLDEGGIDR